MGKPTGFIEYSRESLKKELPEVRVKNYKEFEFSYSEEAAKTQAARCMDCGVPFCHGPTGCPVVNYIPEWNDLVYNGKWKEALDNLHSTNNFPEFTGRLCPAPCEGACVLGINEPSVSIKSIERTIIDKGFENGWVTPIVAKELLGQTVAVVGSGPAGLTVAQQLVRQGYSVTVYEKSDRIGGLLRYGIPDFKMEKYHIDRRMKQMIAEGVVFKTNVHVGVDITAEEIKNKFDAVVLACGSESPRDLPIPGRDLKGVYFAMQYLTQQNKINAGDSIQEQILATNKDVIVIGGGDTGSDCIGTAKRQGAKSVKQFELFPAPPQNRSTSNPWPFWPLIYRTSSSHEEGVERIFSINTLSFNDNGTGSVSSLTTVEVDFINNQFVEKPNTKKDIKADLVLLAMGFVNPIQTGLIEQFQKLGLELDNRNNIKAIYGDAPNAHQTNISNVFACGDVRRGQSLIVWAITEGRKCATAIDKFLKIKR